MKGKQGSWKMFNTPAQFTRNGRASIFSEAAKRGGGAPDSKKREGDVCAADPTFLKLKKNIFGKLRKVGNLPCAKGGRKWYRSPKKEEATASMRNGDCKRRWSKAICS